jgi:hypothetical protein
MREQKQHEVFFLYDDKMFSIFLIFFHILMYNKYIAYNIRLILNLILSF